MAPLNSVVNMAHDVEKAATTAPNSPAKPHLLFAIPTFDGHTIPPLRVAEDLIKKGYEVTFIGGEQFEGMIKRAGAKFVGIPDVMTPSVMEARLAIPAGMPRLIHDIKHVFIDSIPERWEPLKHQLERLRIEKPDREIIIVSEMAFMGTLPLALGAPLPRGFDERPKIINLNTLPYTGTSIDTGPLCYGLPPDATKSGRA